MNTSTHPPAAQPALMPAIACLALILALVTNFCTIDLDAFHEMALARRAFQTGAFPYHEFASFTATANPVIHHEWLTGFIFYIVAITTGAGGFMAFKYLLVAALIAVAAHAAFRRGATPATFYSLAPLAAMVGCMGLTTIRAQVFTMLLTAALLALLAHDRPGHRRWLLLWLPLQLLWINLHAGFVAGPGILLCVIVEQTIRRRHLPKHLLALLLASIAITPINPYGIAYLPFIWRSITMNRQLITEWNAIWKGSAPLLIFFVFSLLMPAYAFLKLRWQRMDGIILLAVTAVLSVLHARHASLYAIVWLAYVPAWIQQTPLGAELTALWLRRPGRVNLLAAVVILGALFIALPRHPWLLAIPTVPDPEHPTGLTYPAGAVDYLRSQHFRGNLMTPFEVGAFVSWKLLPDVKVGLDSRYEVAYDPAFVLTVHRMYTAAPGWQTTLDHIHPDLVLVSRFSALSTALSKSVSWKLIYQDDAYLLFAPPSSPLPITDHRGLPIPATFP